MKKTRVTLNYSEGSNEGRAIYLCETEEDGSGSGTRIAGGKCWGSVIDKVTFQMNATELDEAAKEMKRLSRKLKRQDRKERKTVEPPKAS